MANEWLDGSRKPRQGRKINRGRESRLLGPPSLRTGLADLPHPALRLVVHLRED